MSCLAAAPLPSSLFRPATVQRRGRLAAARVAASQDSSSETIQLTLRKPLGLVLAERKVEGAKGAEVFVDEIVPGGNAEKDGRVRVGDVLSKCSATLLKAGKEGEFEREGYGQRPYDNWEQVMFDCRGKQFDTVMSALGSNSERWGIFTIQLEFLRKAAATDGAAAAAASAEQPQ